MTQDELNSKDLPNPYLLKTLYEIWQKPQGNNLSSHWEKYAPQSQLVLENDKVVRLKGIGFGAMERSVLGLAFEWLTITSYLAALENRGNILKWMKLANSHLKALKKLHISFTYDVFRQCCVAATLEEHIKKFDNPSLLMIGDGYGLLSVLIKDRFPNTTIHFVDILPALFFQATTMMLSFPESKHQLASEKTPNKPDFIYCHPNNLQDICEYKYDLCVNVASMQEMNMESINNYFKLIRNQLKPGGLFYCCNRIEKQHPNGEIIRFNEYPWQENDKTIFCETPAFYRWFFSNGKTTRKLKIGGIQIPFGRLFDGDFLHKLAVIHTTENQG